MCRNNIKDINTSFNICYSHIRQYEPQGENEK